jgi:hypothetical protein
VSNHVHETIQQIRRDLADIYDYDKISKHTH